MSTADKKVRELCDSKGITLHWHTCEYGWHSVDPAPKGKGTWVHMADAANLIERIAALEQKLEQERKTYQTNLATMQQNERGLIESHTRELAQARADRDTLRAILIEIGRDAGCVLADNVSTEFLANLPNELRLQRERLSRPVTDKERKAYNIYDMLSVGEIDAILAARVRQQEQK